MGLEGRVRGGEGTSVGSGLGVLDPPLDLPREARRGKSRAGGSGSGRGPGARTVWPTSRVGRVSRRAGPVARPPMENVGSARRGDASRGDARGGAGAAAADSRAKRHARTVPTDGRAIGASSPPRVGLGRKVGASRRCAIRACFRTRNEEQRGQSPEGRAGRRAPRAARRQCRVQRRRRRNRNDPNQTLTPALRSIRARGGRGMDAPAPPRDRRRTMRIGSRPSRGRTSLSVRPCPTPRCGWGTA